MVINKYSEDAGAITDGTSLLDELRKQKVIRHTARIELLQELRELKTVITFDKDGYAWQGNEPAGLVSNNCILDLLDNSGE